ncbi:MAG TPA: histidine kinase [Cyanobacteria bacterium UBA8553]|nr:histidine kinase [Cyanobacteria bacterium UBA8553]HAJ61621.1 histidine kinase [Cyanobacteria bacterium UBA8543]
MNLRQKTLLLIGLTLTGLVGVLYASLSTIFGRSFTELEQRNAYKNIRRVQEAMFDELQTLRVTAADYAEWDDTYAFMEDMKGNYVQANLLDENFVRLRLNFFLLFNTRDEQVVGKGFNLKQEKATPIPKSFQKQLAPGSILLKHPNTASSISGLILLPEGSLLIASNPILTSKNTGPSRGSLVIGSYLNDQKIKDLAKRTHLSVSMYRVDDAQLPPDFQAMRSTLEKSQVESSRSTQTAEFITRQAPIKIQPLSADAIAGYTLLRDIYGKPAVLLRVDMPRDIYKQGQTSLFYLILSLLSVGIVFGGGTLLLLEKMVLSRLANLSTSVERIGTSSDLSMRVLVSGNDELTSLANTINSMLVALESSAKKLAAEREKAERLLLNVLPESIAKRLQYQQDTIADNFEEVTVLFADIVDFTKISGQISPTELVGLLNEIFSRFDRLVERYDLEKIKTIGDSYMVVGGLPLLRPDHAEAVAEFALDMQQEINEFNAKKSQVFRMRIGIHSGPVVAGVIGLKKFIYDLWGDTVNTASRMESHGIPGSIQVSSSTYERLQDKYLFQERGVIDVKGKGKMTTYLLMSRKLNDLPVN